MFPRSAKVGAEGKRFDELLAGVGEDDIPRILIDAFREFTGAVRES